MKRFDFCELIVGAIILLIGVLLGSFWLSASGDIISKWASSIGSLATAGTLGFLILQNIQIRKRQDRQQSQQHKQWRKENEMLSFEKFQLHRKMFFDELEELENRDELNAITFFNKPALYKKLFPDNSFTNTTYKTDYLTQTVNREVENFTRQMEESTLADDELILRYDQLLHVLNISYNHPYQLGRIYSQFDETNFNLFSPDLPLIHFKAIANALFRFSGDDENYCRKIPSFNDKHIRQILSNISSFDYPYNIALGGIKTLFWDLWSTNLLLDESRRSRFSKRPTGHLSKEESRLICFPYLGLFTPENLSKLETDLCFRNQVIGAFIKHLDNEANCGTKQQPYLLKRKNDLGMYLTDSSQ